jgi:hypothetical protein
VAKDRDKEATEVIRISPGDDITDSPAEKRALRDFLKRYRSDEFLAVKGKKPDKHYLWVNSKSRSVELYKEMGFRVCKDPDIVVWQSGGLDAVKPDGSKVIGDVILMEIPRERWEWLVEFREERRREASRAAARAKETFHEEGRKIGVGTFEDRRDYESFRKGV